MQTARNESAAPRAARAVCLWFTMCCLGLLGMPLQAQQPTPATRDLARRLAVPVDRIQNESVRALVQDKAVAVQDIQPQDTKRAVTLVERVGTKVQRVQTTGRDLDSPVPQAAYALPIHFRALAQSTPQAAPQPVEFEPVVLIMSGLRFKQQSQRFDGELAVGLRNRQKPDDRSLLVEPVKLLIRADADEVTPAELEIKQLGEPLRVLIGVSNPTSPFEISARTLLDDGDTIDMPISRPSLTIEPVRPTIEGWGLGKTLIQVQAQGLDHPEKFSVGLSTTQGEVSPTPITLQPDGRATAELRSDSTGTATVRVTGAPLQAAATQVSFVTPWRFLIAALLGAAVGWFLRTRGRSKSVRSVALAIAAAAVLLVAYMIGIRWMQWTPAAQIGEALAFFIGAMGAYLGLQALLSAGKTGP